MKKYFNHPLLVVLLLFNVIALTACSSETSNGSDSVLTEIKKSGVLKVGLDATFKPFEFKSGGEFQGFDVDLITAIAKELGADVEITDTEFKGLIPGLQAGKFDIIASSMYITDERKETIDFSDSYYPGGLSIMVKKDNTGIQSIEDLNGKKVSVQIGTKSVDFLEKNYPNIKLVKVERNTDMFLELETDKVDAVVTGLPGAQAYIKETETMKVLPDTLTEEYYGFGIRKKNAKFTSSVNKALQTLKDNGTYDELVSKWF